MARKAPDRLVPNGLEDLSGKDLTEQPEESWRTVREQSGHEGDEQSVTDQAVHRTSSFHESAGC